MSGGLIALSSVQRGYETTAGTAVAATSVQPILGGWLREVVERQFPAEQRNSFIGIYRNFAIRNYVEINGLQIAPTFEEVAGWGSLFWKGLAAGSPRKPTASSIASTTVAFYTHTPTIASDDLNTATLEVGDDTQFYQVPYVIGNRVVLGYSASGPLTMTMDFLGQRAVATSKTAGLTTNTVEDIIGAATTVYIDTTTMGNTAVTNAVEMTFTWDNGWSQEFVLNGQLYPVSAHRGATRSCMLEATLLFNSNAEYTLYQNSGIGTPRLIRASTDGSVIAGSTGSVTKNLTVQGTFIHDTAEFDTINGQRAVRFNARSQYNSTFQDDWRVIVRHGLSTIP